MPNNHPQNRNNLTCGAVDEIPPIKVMEQFGVFQDKTGWAKAAPPKKRGVKKK